MIYLFDDNDNKCSDYVPSCLLRSTVHVTVLERQVRNISTCIWRVFGATDSLNDSLLYLYLCYNNDNTCRGYVPSLLLRSTVNVTVIEQFHNISF